MVPESNEVVPREKPSLGDRLEAMPSAEAPPASSGPYPEPSADRDLPPVTTPPERTDGAAEAAGDAASPDHDAGDPAPAEEHEQHAAEGGVEAPAHKKRRRRRRGKKHPAAEGAAPPANGTETAEAEPRTAEPAAADQSQRPPDAAKAKGGRGPKGGKETRARAGKKRPHSQRSEHPPRERTAFHVGEEVFGRVTSVTSHAVMVDLSGKALAIFDRAELAADDMVPEVGDRFVAHVHGDGSRGGLVVLTRKPLREEDTKPRIEEAAKSGATISGLVTGTIKGGVEVDIDGLRAFAPASHVELRPGADLAHLIGQRLDFVVAQYEKRGRDVVVSRKTFLEAEAKEHRKASLSKLTVGSVVKGVVRSVVSYGAFVAIPEADDVEGLVHMTEASHDRNAKLQDVFKPGETIDVKILRVDDKGKLWLSHKAATLDPWEEAMKTFAQGTHHRGRVLRLLPFGAFVELAPGIEGLLHTADLSFKRIEHPKDVLKEDEEIEVVVSDLDRSSHKLTLHPAPPAGEESEPRQRVAPHKVLKVAVVVAETAGLIVRIVGSTGRQARGFIPAGHTGTERGTDLRKHFPPGTRLEAKVLEIDPRRGEAKLSLRAFREDTEKAAYNEYRASVAKASKFGTLGDLLAAAKKR